MYLQDDRIYVTRSITNRFNIREHIDLILNDINYSLECVGIPAPETIVAY